MSLDPNDQSEEFKAYQESLGAEELSRDHVIYEPQKKLKKQKPSDDKFRIDPFNDKMS